MAKKDSLNTVQGKLIQDINKNHSTTVKVLNVDGITGLLGSRFEVTSPFILGSDGSPDSSGVLSYDIFGFPGTKERMTNIGWIDLKRPFIHPFVYNTIRQMLRMLPEIINGSVYVKLDDAGHIVKTKDDDNSGETGIDFFYNNWDKINWDTGSKSRAKKQALFEGIDKKQAFINTQIVLPAGLRDVNLHGSGDTGKIDMDESNSIYLRIVNLSNSTSLTFTSGYQTQSSMQSAIVELHDLFTNVRSAGKNGIIRKSIMGKTIDYAAITVISAPQFYTDNLLEQRVPFNYIGVPLHLLCATFQPLIVNAMTALFEDVSSSTEIILSQKVQEVTEEVRYKVGQESVEELIKAYINDKTRAIRTAKFDLSDNQKDTWLKAQTEFVGRTFTVTDLIYLLMVDIVRNRRIMYTRFPVTDSGSEVFADIAIMTTEDTVNIANPNSPDSVRFFSYYPKFPMDDKGKIDESKVRWIDTTVPNNATLAAQGGE